MTTCRWINFNNKKNTDLHYEYLEVHINVGVVLLPVRKCNTVKEKYT